MGRVRALTGKRGSDETPDHARAPGVQDAPGGDPDRIFAETDARISDFAFDSATADVFDDMVGRSVPFYAEIQRMACQLAADFGISGTSLYDYGCATGTTLHALHDVMPGDVRFVGIDNSHDMLAKANSKLAGLEGARSVKLVEADINFAPPPEDASVVLMILTLQFVRPLYRERVMARIYESLNHQGCLILVEKILGANGRLNRHFIEHYYAHKRRRGYTDVEITRKREALENVLVPYRFDENVELLRNAGFTVIEEFFRWYNFCGIVAVK